MEINAFIKSGFSGTFKEFFAINFNQFAPLTLLNIQFLDTVVRVTSWMLCGLRLTPNDRDRQGWVRVRGPVSEL